MKTILVTTAVALTLSTSAAALTAQQEKMKTCNAEATQKGLRGNARKTFMSDCLAAGSATATPLTSQQQKMKTCNTAANTQGLKGDARQAFMSSCLSGQ